MRESGFSLLEVLFSLVLVGILAVAIPSALSVSNKSTIISNEQTLAESLARSQMDYIQNQTYDNTNNPPVYTTLSSLSTGYSILLQPVRLDPRGNGTSDDDGLQKITVTVMRGSTSIYTLIDFKYKFK
jgi:prepilin-type N-terminal cleavage/methylation domain-containing protein